MNTISEEVIGLIPAAGFATRIAPLPCSKELYPIGFHGGGHAGYKRPKVAAHYLLEKMRFAGVSNAFFVLRPGKWDIPAYFGDGSMLEMNLAYLTIDSSQGVPFTIDQAYSFVRNSRVAFGFPDILFGPADAFAKILTLQSRTKADAVLGLWRRRPSPKYDGVHFDDDGNVREVILGSSDETVRHSWAIAVWSPIFTTFLHDYVNNHRVGNSAGPELTVGHAMRASIASGLKFQAIVISDEFYLDIGTPDGLALAVRLGLEGRL